MHSVTQLVENINVFFILKFPKNPLWQHMLMSLSNVWSVFLPIVLRRICWIQHSKPSLVNIIISRYIFQNIPECITWKRHALSMSCTATSFHPSINHITTVEPVFDDCLFCTPKVVGQHRGRTIPVFEGSFLCICAKLLLSNTVSNALYRSSFVLLYHIGPMYLVTIFFGCPNNLSNE